MSHRLTLLVLIVVSGLMSLAAFIPVITSDSFRGVMPRLVDDDLYYYARMREVFDGNLMVGNPYFLEHAEAPSVAFSLTDVVAATPLLLGMPFVAVVITNHILWSILFVVLTYWLVYLITRHRYVSAFGAIFAYVQVYWLILRPVIMQQVFPFFTLFLISFFYWLESTTSKKRIVALTLSAAATFYIYGFLWQVVFFIMLVGLLLKIMQRAWGDVRTLLLVAGGVAILALPAIIYAVQGFSDLIFWETLDRVGLVFTRLPALDSYYYGRWMIFLLATGWVIHRWLNIKQRPIITRTALGLFLASVSAVAVGSDFATGQHVGRFITFFFSIAIIVQLYDVWEQRDAMKEVSSLKISTLLVLLSIGSAFLINNVQRAVPLGRLSIGGTSSVQSIAEPLRWLEAYVPEKSVVMANDVLSSYIPIMTKHAVAWSHAGSLYHMSIAEVEERFFMAQSSALSRDQVLAKLGEIDGAGIERRLADSYHKQQLRCLLFMPCHPTTSLSRFVGAERLDRLMIVQDRIRSDMYAALQRYNVDYLLVDTFVDIVPSTIMKYCVIVWNDDRYIIYKIN
ncbi:MAG: hypothetical protein KBC02_00180 [Candidatus Pacebacteria bacterium]|nr:hypothetical protein [Candidatus Paceibacterota bacterium]